MKKIKNKIYNLIGQAIVYISLWLIVVYLNYNLLNVILDNCITVYR